MNPEPPFAPTPATPPPASSTGPVMAVGGPSPTGPVPSATPNGTGKFTDYFTLATPTPVIPRLAISLDAQTKCGKSHWAIMTAPDPIAVAYTDDGTEYVIQKAIRAGRRIYAFDLRFHRPERRTGRAEESKAIWQGWVDTWERFKNGMKAVAQNKEIRTVVRDTESELWALCQLAHFGKMDKIPQHRRTDCNSDYISTFRTLYARPDLNIILIHTVKKQYEGRGDDANWNGKWERDGMNKVGFLVDLNMQAGWDGLKRCFYTEISREQASRQLGGELAGKRWEGEASHFGYLGCELFPGTVETPEVWGIKL